MTTTIVITNIQNINFESNSVINNELIIEEIYDSDMDIFLFEDNTGKQRKGNLMGVSLYNDLIIRDDNKFKILKMLSK